MLKQMIAGTFLESIANKVVAVVKGPPTKSRLYDMQTFEVMKRTLKEDSNCVDVGCHRGGMLRELLRLAPKGNHYAFEPLPGFFQGMKKSFGTMKNVFLYDCALSDTAGTTTFQHVVSNPAYSGLRPRRYKRPDEKIQQITVKTELLDNIVPKGVPIHFIKIDVEGGELGVLRGAVEIIKKDQPVVVFEHGRGAADYYGTGPEDVYDLLAGQCGLRLFLMADWLATNGAASLNREAFLEQFSLGNEWYYMAAR